MTCKCHLDESTNGRYDMILGRDLLNALGLDLKFSDCVILGGYGPYKECFVPMVDVINYDFNIITAKTVKPEESFINSYADECFKSKSAITTTRRMRMTLDAKYETADLNNSMNEQCQPLNT